MNPQSRNSGQDIVYVDFTTSAIGTSLPQSSAGPDSLASIMKNASLPFYTVFMEKNIDYIADLEDIDAISTNPTVLDSLEKSLIANSAVWSELSKH